MNGYYQSSCGSEELNPRKGSAVAGNPEVAGKVLYVSPDKKISHGIWQSTPGVFDFHFANDDSGFVLEGEAVAHFPDGTSWRLTAGTLYTFQAGTTIRLEILRTWRKIFFNYHSEGTILRVGY